MMQQMVRCRFCGEVFDSAERTYEHAKKAHPKEVSQLKINAMKKGATTDEDRMALMEAIREHTLQFRVNATDTQAMYTIEEALGTVSMYQFFHSVETCSYKNCKHSEPDPAIVERVLTLQKD